MPDIDVLIAGGGAAGVGAAIGAARAGAHVLLAEHYGFLGGAATNAAVLTYCGLFANRAAPIPAVGGVGADILARLGDKGTDIAPVRSRSGNWIVIFEPERLKLALDEAVLESGATLWLHARVTDVELGAAGDVAAIRVTDHHGTRRIEVGAVVDCSGEGTVAALAGIPAAVDASRGDVVQPASFPLRIGGVPGSGVPDRAPFAAAAAAISAEQGGVREDGGVVIRLPGTSDVWWMVIDLATDGLTAGGLTAAELRGRRLAHLLVETLRAQPGMAAANLVVSGPQIGVRETRRPRTRLTLSRSHGTEGRRSDEGIARAAWPMEVHVAPGRAVFENIGGEGFFDVPLDALRPEGVDNLWLGGRVIGADAAAYGSVRVMGTGFATGQAAGVAAAIQARSGRTPTAAEVRQVLASQGALL